MKKAEDKGYAELEVKLGDSPGGPGVCLYLLAFRNLKDVVDRVRKRLFRLLLAAKDGSLIAEASVLGFSASVEVKHYGLFVETHLPMVAFGSSINWK